MTAIAWPEDLVPQRGAFWLEPNTLLSESPYSRAQQVVARDGDRWRARMAWQSAPESLAGRIDALLAQLRGAEGEVTLYDWRRPVPRGTAGTWPGGDALTSWGGGTTWGGGTSWGGLISPPLVPQLRFAAVRGDRSLHAWGWAASQTVLRAGDRIGLAGQLLVVTADVVGNAGGVATIAVEPPLRADVDGATALVLTRPRARFRLVDNDQAATDFEPGPFSSYNLEFVESLP